MTEPPDALESILSSLQERAKELECLYAVEEILHSGDLPLKQMLQKTVAALGPGFQYAEICEVEIEYEGHTYRSSSFEPTPWMHAADIRVQGETVGELRVYYLEERPEEDEGPFLKEEVRLIATVSRRLGSTILYHRLRDVRQDWQEEGRPGLESWRGPFHLLRESDKNLYLRIARKMLNHLCRIGVRQAHSMLRGGSNDEEPQELDETQGEVNVPGRLQGPDNAVLMSDQPFELASEFLEADEMLTLVQKWMQEDKAGFFIRTLNNPRSSLPEITDAIRRFHAGLDEGSDLPPSSRNSMRVSLIQRLLTEQLDFTRIAREYVETHDFEELLERMILPAESHGKVGGKSAGLLLAERILHKTRNDRRPIGEVKTPKTWYVPSDGILDFIAHNDLQDVYDQKFKEIDQIRQEYPNIIQLFKSCSLTPRVLSGLSMALDDFGDVPLIVRSSSLLEDRLGTAFSGKYKSLFVANQGSKSERMAALVDAITEIYASTFGPDPLEYRRERGLLEFNEEMGLLIQEVVGTRVGHYWLPAFAGVAFSNNEFRWSPRIKREDGIIRLVPGLGTRAVDRVSDDYPIMVVPAQPNLRVNVAIDEVVRYAPRCLDVINLDTNTLETVSVDDLLREVGGSYPALPQVFSVLKEDMLQKPVPLLTDPDKDELVANFEGLIAGTPFVKHLGNILNILQERLGTPVDVEFAHDGKHFYLLQCRPQSFTEDSFPAPIPKDVAPEDVLFSADRYVSNGWVPDITHLVYVDPERYSELESRAELLAVGRVVGKLNKLLPKRQFVLMGPGRWGSRGDIKLGVSVTYSDISNTSMLIEIARQKGGYVPDLSFGTHFFQDLVESRIRYLPLYPDDPGIRFHQAFLRTAPNLLPEIVPGAEELAEVVRVIDIPAVADGRILRVLMNAELDEAVGILTVPGQESPQPEVSAPYKTRRPEQYWRWRLKMVERLATEMDPERFGVAALYVFGSTKNATAGPDSDIDLLVHFRGDEAQRRELSSWLEGWSLCLGEMNYLRTGYRTGEILDVHFVTDQDIADGNSFATKIGAVTDAARPLPLGPDGRRQETSGGAR